MELGITWLPVEAEVRPGRGSRTLVAQVVPDAAHHGMPGVLHGGMCATLLDECMGALSHALDRHATITGLLQLKYRRPVPLDGSTVTLEAWRDRSDLRRRNRVAGRLLLADGAIAVEATGVFLAAGPLESPLDG